MLALSAGVGSGPAGGLGDETDGGGALGSAPGSGAGAATGLGLSSPSNADCRCDAASAKNWATGGSALRVGSMGRDMGENVNGGFWSDWVKVNSVVGDAANHAST